MAKKISVLIGGVVLILLVGVSYQYVSERHDRQKIPGKLISIGDKEVHVLCKGKGSHTVILENGTWGSYPDWLDVIESAQHVARVCSYDRLGIGWSSGNGKPTNAADIVEVLKAVIEELEVDNPVVLVGFSAGGIYVRKYFEKFPTEVSGIILVDSAHEQQAVRNAYRPNDLKIVKVCAAVAWTGVVRLFGLMEENVPIAYGEQRTEEQLGIYNRTGFCSGLLEQSKGFVTELTPEYPKSLGDIPLIVIQSDRTLREQGFGDMFSDEFLDSREKEWPQMQKELAGLSSDSELWTAQDSGHSIAEEAPQIIVQAISKSVAKVQSANTNMRWMADGDG